MRAVLALVVAVCAAAVAGADPAGLPVVDPGALPEGCGAVAQVPDDVRAPGPILEADIAGATCAAEARLRAIPILPTASTVQAMADALRPSIALLEAVVATGDPTYAVLAAHAEDDLYAGVAVRLLASVPALPPEASEAVRRAHDKLQAQAERLAEPWRRRAHRLARR